MDERPTLSWETAAGIRQHPLAEWHEAYHAMLVAYARSRMGPAGHADAADIVQEAFIDLHQRLQVDGVESIRHPRAWLCKAVRNRAAHWRRGRDREQRHEREVRRRLYLADEETVEGAYLHGKQCGVAADELRALPSRERRALGSWARRKSLHTIAAQLGVSSRGRASAFVQRIIRTLRRRVSDA